MFRFSNQSIVPSKFVFGVGNFGVLFDDVPTTGENGASILLNDGGVSSDRVRALVTVWPIHGTLFVYENGSFEYTGNGDTDSFVYTDYINGVANNNNTVNLLTPLSDSNILISDTLPSLLSSMSLVNAAPEYNVSINDGFASLQSAITIESIVPEYTISVSDSFGALQSSMSLVNGIPEHTITIVETLPALSSSLQMTNIVPEYSLGITTSLPSLQSAISLTYEDANPDIAIIETLGSLQSSITLTNIVPQYTLEITDTFGALQSGMTVINGELVINVNPKNLITIKSKSRFINLNK